MSIFQRCWSKIAHYIRFYDQNNVCSEWKRFVCLIFQNKMVSWKFYLSNCPLYHWLNNCSQKLQFKWFGFISRCSSIKKNENYLNLNVHVQSKFVLIVLLPEFNCLVFLYSLFCRLTSCPLISIYRIKRGNRNSEFVVAKRVRRSLIFRKLDR